MSESLSIRLPRQLQKDLDGIAKEDRRSRSDVIRNALEQYLSVRKFRGLRKKVMPFAAAQGLLTDDDVFNNLSER